MHTTHMHQIELYNKNKDVFSTELRKEPADLHPITLNAYT